MRARKKKWAESELTENNLIINNLSSFYDTGKQFNLEIGCGKGKFITETALKNPDEIFIGLEREDVILAAAARRAREMNVPNCRFILDDVKNLEEIIKPGFVSLLYINFCDPWHRKKKQAKRRLTHDNFLRIYQRLGIKEIHFKTDNRILFEFSLESFNRCGWRFENISLDLHKSNFTENVQTEYEAKFSPFGPIYRLQAINVD